MQGGDEFVSGLRDTLNAALMYLKTSVFWEKNTDQKKIYKCTSNSMQMEARKKKNQVPKYKVAKK